MRSDKSKIIFNGVLFKNKGNYMYDTLFYELNHVLGVDLHDVLHDDDLLEVQGEVAGV